MQFLRKTWYVAGFCDEVDEQHPLLARRLLDEPVVFFRDAQGALHALADRCPHRFVPLSMGRRKPDGTLECGYHGLCFDAEGACTHNPHGDGKIPAAARVKAFAVVERHGLIWWWGGDAASADASRIPDFGFLLQGYPESNVRGYLDSRCDYRLIIDNILDATHADFVHAGTLGSGVFTKVLPTLDDLGEGNIRINWSAAGGLAPEFFDVHLRERGQPTDQWMQITWHAPSVLRLDVGATLQGEPRESGTGNSVLHVATPETAQTCHYWYWGTSKTSRLTPPAQEMASRMARHAFEHEDKPIVEAQHRAIGDADLWSLRPVLLPGDAGAVRARRKLDALIAAEAGRC